MEKRINNFAKTIISDERTYFYLLSLHQILMLTSLCFVHRFVSIANLNFPLSALIFPLTFLTTDLAATISHKRAKRMMWLGILAQLPFALLCMLADTLPQPEQYANASAYHLVFADVLRTACASIFGCAIGQTLNIYIYSKLQQRLQKLKFSWNYLISATCGQIIFTVVALPLVFWGQVSNKKLLLLIAGSICTKFIYSIILALIIGRVMQWYTKRNNRPTLNLIDYRSNRFYFAPLANHNAEFYVAVEDFAQRVNLLHKLSPYDAYRIGIIFGNIYTRKRNVEYTCKFPYVELANDGNTTNANYTCSLASFDLRGGMMRYRDFSWSPTNAKQKEIALNELPQQLALIGQFPPSQAYHLGFTTACWLQKQHVRAKVNDDAELNTNTSVTLAKNTNIIQFK